MTLPPYSVTARNIDPAADNRIHADDVAQSFGFTGALVPGVELFAYLTAPLVAHWGLPWLSGGRVDVRFRRPVYDGEQLRLDGDPEALALIGADGVPRAVGSAGPPVTRTARRVLAAAPLPEPLPPTATLSVGPLGTVTLPVTVADNLAYVDAVAEPSPLYREQGIAHPGGLLRLVNAVLMRNVDLGPWIHTASECWLLATARLPATLSARAEVTELFDRNGSSYVRYDAVVCCDDVPVMDVAHTAIYQLGA